MRVPRPRQLLAVLAGVCGSALLVAAPGTADVSCSDLGSQVVAQSYLQAKPGDPDALDGDGDGRPCEGMAATHHTDWSLIGLGGLIAVALAGNWVVGSRQRGRRSGVSQERSVASALPLARPGQKASLIAAAPTGTIAQLGRALRLVPSVERMSLVGEHARAHGCAPQEVLDALATDPDDLELQRWALAGLGPSSSVRLMRCSCVDGLRNFTLQVTPEGTRAWSCATCKTAVPQRA